MILFHTRFHYLENCLLYKFEHSPTISSVSTRTLKFQLRSHLYGWVSQWHRCWITKFPRHSPVHLLRSMISGQVSEPQNNVWTEQPHAKLWSQQRLPDSLLSWTKSSSGPLQMESPLMKSWISLVAFWHYTPVVCSLQPPTLFHSESHN